MFDFTAKGVTVMNDKDNKTFIAGIVIALYSSVIGTYMDGEDREVKFNVASMEQGLRSISGVVLVQKAALPERGRGRLAYATVLQCLKFRSLQVSFSNSFSHPNELSGAHFMQSPTHRFEG